MNAREVVVDGTDANRLFVATYGGGVYTSANGGASWAACATQPDSGSAAGLKVA